MTVPKAFISYSHDSQEHKKWVLELAIRLRNNGIDAIIDQFELKAGDDVPHFMETNLEKADKIVMVCSERYVEKANNGEGGVGYEKIIITSNLLKRIDENKIIPIIKQNSTNSLPTFLKSKLYINFSKKDDFEFNYDNLARTIHHSPLFEKPAIGNNPFTPIQKEQLDGDIKVLNEALRTIAQLQGVSSSASSERVARNMNISHAMFRVIGIKLNQLGYAQWAGSITFIRITDKGLMYAYNNALIS